MTFLSKFALTVCLTIASQSPYVEAFQVQLPSTAFVSSNVISNSLNINAHSNGCPGCAACRKKFCPGCPGGCSVCLNFMSKLQLRRTQLNMASTLENLPESAVEVTITAPSQATQAAYDKAVTELSKNLTIPGFRKGAKIPPAVIENAMAARGGKNAIKVQAINDLANRLIGTALKDEHGLEPIGQPALTASAEELASSFVPGEELVMVVKCDVWPEIKFKEMEDGSKAYFNLKGKYQRKPFDQARFDIAINDLKDRYAKLTPIEDQTHKLQMGDACVVNMVGYMANEDNTKGEPLPNAASGEDVEVILGQGRYMEGLVEGIMGASVGDTVPVTVTFPERLKDKTLAGKTAIFDVTIQSASVRTLPELDDEFANTVRPGLTADSLVAELKKAIDEEDAKQFVNERNAALSKALAEVVDAEVPDTIVTTQAREKYAQMMAEFRDQGMADEEIKKMITPENFLKYKDIYKADIVKDFKVTLAVEEIIKLEGLEVPAYQVEEQMENLKMEAQKAGDEFDESQIQQRVQATLESRVCFDFLAEKSALEVEYVDENQQKIDEQMLAQLAEESLKREGFDGDFEDIPVENEQAA